jgi:MscS family membrane protein
MIYNNTLAEWLVSIGIIAGTFLIAKILFWISGNIIKKIIKKTRTNFDDLVIDRIEKPVIFGFVLAGIWFGLNYLNLSDKASTFISKAYYVTITFNIAWMVARLGEAIIVNYLAVFIKRSEETSSHQFVLVIKRGFNIVVWTTAAVLGLKNAGYDVGAILAGLGLGGLAFALAAKDSLTNLFGGIAVLTDKPFKINDRIQIDGYDGTVIDIGMRSTKLRTIAGNRVVTIPNHKLTTSYIENVTSEPSRKMSVVLNLTYNTNVENIQKAIDIIKEIDRDSPYTDEGSTVYFETFGPYSLDIRFYYFIKPEENYWYLAPNEINMQILKRFNEAGLEFAFPTQTIITENNT